MGGKPQMVGTNFHVESWPLEIPSKDFHSAIWGGLGWIKWLKNATEKGYIFHAIIPALYPFKVTATGFEPTTTLFVNEHSMILPNWPVWLNGWVFLYKLSGCGFESRCCLLKTSDMAPASSKKFFDIQATIERRFTLKLVRDMLITYSYILFDGHFIG